jgi:hypothetical protein
LKLKKFYIIFIFFIISPGALFSQAIKGRFDLARNDSNSITIKIQIASAGNTIQLGNATFRFTYDDSCLNPSETIGFYKPEKIKKTKFTNITIPAKGVISLNIANKNGNSVKLDDRFLDLAVITFGKKSNCKEFKFDWRRLELFEPHSNEKLFTQSFKDLVIIK